MGVEKRGWENRIMKPRGSHTHFNIPRACPETYVIRWWMGHWGSPTPKREVGYTNNRFGESLNKGKWVRPTEQASVVPVRTYRNAAGQKKYVGTRQLKQTQPETQVRSGLSKV